MKKVAKIIGIILGVLVAIPLILLLTVGVRTHFTQDDYSAVYTDPKYQNPVKIANVEVIQQHISCGYAVIEMFSAWNGGNVTEDSLYDEYGTVVTSSGKNFCKEMNKQFPEYTTTMHRYVKNSEFIDIMYDTLKSGKPVPFEWAALYGDEWTLHYSLIVGADIPNDTVTVAKEFWLSATCTRHLTSCCHFGKKFPSRRTTSSFFSAIICTAWATKILRRCIG